MSSDIEQFAAGSRNMHECWACTIELALSIWLLAEQLGVGTTAVGGLTILSLAMLSLVVKAAGKRQNAWLKSVEHRISGTTQALKAMKGIKMTGLEPTIRTDLARLRKLEVRKMRRFRAILSVVLWAMWVPIVMAPILGLTIYNVAIGPRTGRVLTPALVYRCLTLFGLYGNSVSILIKSILDAGTASAALLRIEAFLLGDNTRVDGRIPPPLNSPKWKEAADEMPLLPGSPSLPSTPIRLHTMGRTTDYDQPSLQLIHASARWTTDGPLIVNNAMLQVSASGVIAIVGGTGSGKTTFLQLLLGELPCAQGSIAISGHRIGYCSQAPWLTHESIRDNIIGTADYDKDWYQSVLAATALNQDLASMSKGDTTDVGSAGSSLSGGQKKRIALARAIYSRCPILVLDDPFNGLDGHTEVAVLEAMLGPEGLVRKAGTLVLWATSSSKDFSLKMTCCQPLTGDLLVVQQVRYADRVLSLVDGVLRQQDPTIKVASEIGEVQSGTEEAERGSERYDGSDTTVTSTVRDAAPGLGSDPTSSMLVDQTHAKVPTAFRYYIGGGGKKNFSIFIAVLAIFVVGNMVSREW